MNRAEMASPRRTWIVPMLVLALMGVVIVGLMAPAVASGTNTLTVSIDDAPNSVVTGATLDDLTVGVTGTISIDIVGLPAPAAEASLALLRSNGTAAGGVFGTLSKALAPAVGEGRVAATFDDVELGDVSAGCYDLQVTIGLDDTVLTTKRSPLEVTEASGESPDCGGSPEFDESQDCVDGCSFDVEGVDGVEYTIAGPEGAGGSAGVNVSPENDAFTTACGDLETDNPDRRMLPTTIQVVPSGFAPDDLFTVTVIIPKDVISEDVNRSDKPWTVCFLDDDDQDPDTPKGTTRLLERCEATDDPACLVSLEKFKGANLEMVFEFPAVDPYFR